MLHSYLLCYDNGLVTTSNILSQSTFFRGTTQGRGYGGGGGEYDRVIFFLDFIDFLFFLSLFDLFLIFLIFLIFFCKIFLFFFVQFFNEYDRVILDIL